MSQYLLDCTREVCTMAPYTPPPATVETYALGPEWLPALVAGIVLALILATAIVRYKAHQERGDTERQRILHPPQQCPTCGDVLETEAA